MLATIPLDLIEDGTRLRGVNDDQVAALVESITEVGVLNPITVYARKVLRDGISVDGYGIVAGLHRVAACRSLGLVDIPAHVVDLSELQRQIAECDENLCGPKLTPSERATFTRRRKEAYEALHPETKVGATGAGRDKVRQVGEANDRFTSDTAKKTGQSERAVQRDAERGDKIDPEVMAALRKSKWDKGTVLDTLKKLNHREQRQALFRVQNGSSASFADAYDFIHGEPPAPPKVTKPAAPLNDFETVDKQVAALMAAWNRASKEAREDFLARIDAPVMDKRFA